MQEEILINYFQSFIPLKEKERQALKERARIGHYKRRQLLLKPGEVCRHYFFVTGGLLKMYAVDKKGAKHNIHFVAEKEWISDNLSFHDGKASDLYIEAIEPSDVLQIERTALISLFHMYPKFDRIFRVIAENANRDLQSRMLQTISMNGQERYEAFLKRHQNIANRLSSIQIASYLGITPEFLSRIRGQRLKTNKR